MKDFSLSLSVSTSPALSIAPTSVERAGREERVSKTVGRIAVLKRTASIM